MDFGNTDVYFNNHMLLLQFSDLKDCRLQEKHVDPFLDHE
jgi:hypothetical protein